MRFLAAGFHRDFTSSPFEDVGGERFCTDVRHRVFLYPEVILLKSLSGCGWCSLIPVVVHLRIVRTGRQGHAEVNLGYVRF